MAEIIVDSNHRTIGMLNDDENERSVLRKVLSTLTAQERNTLDYAAMFCPDPIPWSWVRTLVVQDNKSILNLGPGRTDPWIDIRSRLEKLQMISPTDVDENVRVAETIGAHLKSELQLDEKIERLLRIMTVIDSTSKEGDDSQKRIPMALMIVANNFDELGQALLQENGYRDSERAVELFNTVVRLRERLFELSHNGAAEMHGLLAALHGLMAALHELVYDLEVSACPSNREKCIFIGKRFVTVSERILAVSELLLADNPGDKDANIHVADAAKYLAVYIESRGYGDESGKIFKYLERRLAILEQLVVVDPNDTSDRMELVECLNDLGSRMADEAGRNGRAIAYLERSIEIAGPLLQVVTQREETSEKAVEILFQVAKSHSELSRAIQNRNDPGDSETALTLLLCDLQLRERLLVLEPDSIEGLHGMMSTLYRICAYLCEEGYLPNRQAYRETLERMLKFARLLFDDNPSNEKAKAEVENIESTLAEIILTA